MEIGMLKKCRDPENSDVAKAMMSSSPEGCAGSAACLEDWRVCFCPEVVRLPSCCCDFVQVIAMPLGRSAGLNDSKLQR